MNTVLARRLLASTPVQFAAVVAFAMLVVGLLVPGGEAPPTATAGSIGCGNTTPTFDSNVTVTLNPEQGHVGEVLFVDASGLPVSSLNVGTEPHESWMDASFPTAGQVNLSGATQIGSGDRFVSETSAVNFGPVPNVSVGFHNVIFCYRTTDESQSSQWFWARSTVDFEVLAGTPNPTGEGDTPTPTATPAPSPTHTPTPAPTLTHSPTPSANVTPTPRPVTLPFFGFFFRSHLPDFWRALVLPTNDLSISGVEVTQAIQCFDTTAGLKNCPDNSLGLVAQKSTLARTYLHIDGSDSDKAGVPIRLHIFAGGKEYVFDSWGTAHNGSVRRDFADDARVWFNVNFEAGTTASFYAEVDPDHQYAETNENNNRWPATGTLDLNFTRRQTYDVTSGWMNYNPPGAADTGIGITAASLFLGNEWLNTVWPVKNGGIIPHFYPALINWTTVLNPGDESKVRDLGKTMAIIDNIFPWATGPLTGIDRFHIWTPNSHFVRGTSDPAFLNGLGVASVGTDLVDIGPPFNIDTPGFGAVNFAHEVSHNSGLHHTATGKGELKSTSTGNVSCDNSQDATTDWPYSNAKIQEYGIDPDTGVIYDPQPVLTLYSLGLANGQTTYDFMSYCYGVNSLRTFTSWISPYHWQQQFDASPASVAVAQPAAAPGPIIAITANIDNPDIGGDDGGHFGTLYTSDEGPVLSLPAGSGYAVEIRDGSSVLSSQNFDVSFEDAEDPQNPLADTSVSFTMPFSGGTEIVLLRDGEVLDTRAISSHAPTVTVTDPASHENWAAGSTQTLSWTGADEDGDSLTYSVFYAPHGNDFQAIAANLTDTTLQIKVTDLAGGDQAKFRVMASDGVSTGFGDSATVSIPNQPPMVQITNPSDGAFGEDGGLVVLNGMGQDLEDGILPDESLTWSSDIDGDLGIGSQLPLNTLSPGVHHITLTAEDSDGATSESTITLTIGVLGNMSYQPPLINPNSNDDVTAIVTLMPGMAVVDINPVGLVLHIGDTDLTPKSTENLGDTDQDGLPELAVVFDGAAFRAAAGTNSLVPTTLSGYMFSGEGFSARAQAALVDRGDTDCDGDVDGADITGSLAFLAGIDSPGCLFAEDNNCDGDVEAPDVLANLQLMAGISVATPQSCEVPQAVPAATSTGDDGGLPGLLGYGWLAPLFSGLLIVARRPSHGPEDDDTKED